MNLTWYRNTLRGIELWWFSYSFRYSYIPKLPSIHHYEYEINNYVNNKTKKNDASFKQIKKTIPSEINNPWQYLLTANSLLLVSDIVINIWHGIKTYLKIIFLWYKWCFLHVIIQNNLKDQWHRKWYSLMGFSFHIQSRSLHHYKLLEFLRDKCKLAISAARQIMLFYDQSYKIFLK